MAHGLLLSSKWLLPVKTAPDRVFVTAQSTSYKQFQTWFVSFP